MLSCSSIDNKYVIEGQLTDKSYDGEYMYLVIDSYNRIFELYVPEEQTEKNTFNYNDIKQISLNQQQLAFIVCYILMVLFFFILKFSFAIKETFFIVDIVIINFTSALVFKLSKMESATSMAPD